MDIVTYALLTKKLSGISAFDTKGSVASASSLPASADAGDLYIAQDTGYSYVWDGSQWIHINQGFDKKVRLVIDDIPDTVQTITFDSSDNVSTIEHSSGNTAVRTDTFTFADSSITEVRTLESGESLTLVTNLDTLVTTVTYTAA